MQHPLGGIEFLVWEIFMTHDECVSRWTSPHHHPKILPYKHQPLHPLSVLCVWPLVPDEGGGVQHPGDFWGFGPIAVSEAHSSWHCVLSIFQFCDSAEYGVSWAILSELSCFYEWNWTKGCPGSSPHEEHYVKMSASEVHVQRKIWMFPQPTN